MVTEVEVQSGFIKNGPKCGRGLCSSRDWIIVNSEKVVCSNCDTTHTMDSIRGYVKDGPKCGSGLCNSRDWLVGEDMWRCTGCGSKRG